MAVLVLLVKVAMVFGLLAAVLWVLKRTDGLGARGRSGLEVRGSTRLGKGAALTIVRVDGKDLLLGVTDHAVTLLRTEQVPDEPEADPKPTPAATAKNLVALVRDALASRRTTDDVSPDDVASALQTLRSTPRPVEGTTGASTRLATRRRVARTDAQRDEEHLWSRPCRPAFRAADGDDGLA
ncbi:MAG: flagellar biosynthetic protein FliO [Mycobacteriales bacterium]